MKINYKRYEVLKRAANEVLGGYNSDVNICSSNELDVMMNHTGETVKFGVHWASIGTVSVDDAKAFVNSMNKAVRVAEMLNKLDITEISFDEAEDKELATDEVREAFYNCLVTVLESGYLTLLKDIFH